MTEAATTPTGVTSDDDGPWLTIDDFARSTGVTVRNIRAHQARGLLPPPRVRARTGYYGPDHRARLELVTELQAEGVRLETIGKLLGTTGSGTRQVLGFLRRIRELFAQPEGQIVSTGDLAARFGTDDLGLLRKAERAGWLRQVDDGLYQEVDTRLVGAGEALVRLGVPAGRGLDVALRLRRHAESIAQDYVALFLEEVWRPFDAAGRPEEDWPRVQAAVEELRALSGEAVLAVLGTALDERLRVSFGREITRNVKAR